ncbi:protein FAR1-RELATED SEQUENCE 11 [Lolium perenne]|uniref:protein FAR1-RELATED SEQUENCE 11 n=1 Tax=Lolium perenne TaxID=4522 RepID=UPI0021F5E2EC|nr:protein FAR1-RELATED SEQUENCE 11-like [Lolium perenne]
MDVATQCNVEARLQSGFPFGSSLETVPEVSESDTVEDSLKDQRDAHPSSSELELFQDVDSQGAAIATSQTAVGWTRRPRHGVMGDERHTRDDRVSALEKSFRGFAERKSVEIVNPCVGLTFDSIGEAYDYYNLYSWECGFGIRYGKSRTNVKGTKSMQELLCVCAGKPKEVNTTSCRCQCPGMVRLLRTDDQGWYIAECRLVHNHRMLVNCAQKLHFPSHRHIDKYTRELVSQLRENNVNLSKVYSIIGTFFGRIENVPFTKRCLRTLCGKISKEQADDDVKKTMEIFSELKEKDSEFTYTVQVDADSRIQTLLWTNGRSKLQYHHFGDIVTFDTTYKTNLYDMPFGIFVGVNNHFQSVLYAGVLMRDEKIESFEWVFREFVKMMGGKKPITILTDQARAMEVAIGNVFPGTTHRWCKWHVLRKAKEHLGMHYTKKSGFREEFHNLVDEMLTVAEFEKGWQELVEKYGLVSNTFLIQVYEVRKKWAKPYFSGKFCAKQTSTQRSESANHMLKNYVPPACPMNVFVKQYGKLQYDREQEEGFQEKRTSLAGAVIKNNEPIERHASKIYTRAMFEMFGRALYVAGSYTVEEVEPQKKYIAVHMSPETRPDWYKHRYEVSVSADGSYYTCECGRFEHMGMICCHILKVLITKNVRKIPDKHIMKRWTVDARDILPDHIKHYQKDMGPPEAITFRHSAMYITALELVHMGDTNPDAFECVMSGLCELKQKAVALCDVNDGKSIVEKSRASSLANSVESRQASLGKKKQASADGSGVGASCSSSSFVRGQLLNEDRCEVTSRATVLVEDLLAPERRLKRGLPTTARDKPPYEQNSKRTRFCGICRAAGHKRTTCPQRGDRPVNQRKEPQCSNCGLTGHRKTSCVKPMYSMIPSVQARIE